MSDQHTLPAAPANQRNFDTYILAGSTSHIAPGWTAGDRPAGRLRRIASATFPPNVGGLPASLYVVTVTPQRSEDQMSQRAEYPRGLVWAFGIGILAVAILGLLAAIFFLIGARTAGLVIVVVLGGAIIATSQIIRSARIYGERHDTDSRLA
jgi:hypothetical protein